MRRGRRARSLLRTHILEEIVLLGCWTWSAALSKLIVRECVKDAEARRKVRPKSKNLHGKEAALTHTKGQTGSESTVL